MEKFFVSEENKFYRIGYLVCSDKVSFSKMHAETLCGNTDINRMILRKEKATSMKQKHLKPRIVSKIKKPNTLVMTT